MNNKLLRDFYQLDKRLKMLRSIPKIENLIKNSGAFKNKDSIEALEVIKKKLRKRKMFHLTLLLIFHHFMNIVLVVMVFYLKKLILILKKCFLIVMSLK